jgi:hypothetical protein
MGKNYRFKLNFQFGKDRLMRLKTKLEYSSYDTETIRETWRVNRRLAKDNANLRKALNSYMERRVLVSDGELVLRLIISGMEFIGKIGELTGIFNFCTLVVGSIYEDCRNVFVILLEVKDKRQLGVLQIT